MFFFNSKTLMLNAVQCNLAKIVTLQVSTDLCKNIFTVLAN